MDVRALFERELHRRGIGFEVDPETDGYVVEHEETKLLISLDNLERDLARDGDLGRVARFVDAVVSSGSVFDAAPSADRLFWILEPNDYDEAADFRVPMSDLVDRVLAFVDPEGRLISWADPGALAALGVGEVEAGERAFANLARALGESGLHVEEIDGVRLGMLGTSLPFKTALLLAPNLREVVVGALGWPLLAVAPNRDFLYLWDASNKDFISRVGGVVVEQYAAASYPISTEVWELSDEGMRAIGAFPTPPADG